MSKTSSHPDSQALLAPLAPAMKELEALLEKQCDQFESGVAHCARYVVNNQGKRLRPALVIFSANARAEAALGKVDEDLLKLCAIVELIHMATLVHDDIMDGAEIRRSRPTAGAKWGQEISVLLGDCLFAHALTLSSTYPTTHICRRISEATNQVCSGEILQTQRRFDLTLKEEDYLRIIEMKTGALFAVSCELGAFLSGASEKESQVYHEFGRLLGLAYQIYDDCLDLVGTEKDIGKSLGTDLRKGKLTLPLIHLLKRADKNEHPVVSSILLNEMAHDSSLLRDFIHKHSTIQSSAQQAMGYLDQAIQLLPDSGVNEGKLALIASCEYLRSELESLKA